jgi:hypothetical protein
MLAELSFYIGLVGFSPFAEDVQSCVPWRDGICRPYPDVQQEPVNRLLFASINDFKLGYMVNQYGIQSFIAGYAISKGSLEVGFIAATGYTETPMKDYTVAGLMLYPTLAYSLPLNEHIAFTAITTGIVNNIGLTITF